jgi:hypothetical protein
VPASHAARPSLTDALYILRGSVGTLACDPCECDVDSNGTVGVVDALLTLQAVVGLEVDLLCFEPA